MDNPGFDELGVPFVRETLPLAQIVIECKVAWMFLDHYCGIVPLLDMPDTTEDAGQIIVSAITAYAGS